MKLEGNTFTIAVFLIAFVGSMVATMVVLQCASAQVQPVQTNQTTANNATEPVTLETIAADNSTALPENPLNVTIVGTNAILNFDPTGLNSMIQLVGEVFNNETQAINASDLIIPGTLYDINGTVVGVVSTIPELPVIEQNNSSPFKVIFFDTDVANGVLGALFWKVQAANESSVGIMPPPPPLALGGELLGPPGLSGGPIPGGVPFGFPPIGPLMGAPLPTGPILPVPNNLTNQTTPTTNQTREQPDQSCLFDSSQPRCAPVNGVCPEGFNLNEDGNCFPQHERCPDGYHSEEDNETGECYPDSKPCPQGQVRDPDFPTCVNLTLAFCEEHQDIPECRELLDQQGVALSSNATNANQTNGEEQEEETEEGQEQGQTTSALSANSGQVTIEPEGTQQTQQQVQEVEEEEEEEEEENKEE